MRSLISSRPCSFSQRVRGNAVVSAWQFQINSPTLRTTAQRDARAERTMCCRCGCLLVHVCLSRMPACAEDVASHMAKATTSTAHACKRQHACMPASALVGAVHTRANMPATRSRSCSAFNAKQATSTLSLDNTPDAQRKSGQPGAAEADCFGNTRGWPVLAPRGCRLATPSGVRALSPEHAGLPEAHLPPAALQLPPAVQSQQPAAPSQQPAVLPPALL